MLRRLTSREIAEYMALYRISPWGKERDDFNTGLIASTIVNVFKTKGRKTKPDDFMPYNRRDKDLYEKLRLSAYGVDRTMVRARVMDVFAAFRKVVDKE